MENLIGSQVTEQKNQLEQLARHIPMAVAILDREMRYLFANDRWITDFGLQDKPIIGANHYQVFPEIGDTWKDIHQCCLQGEVHRDDQVPFVRTDGTHEWIKREIRPWFTTQGDIGGLIIYVEFITDRKQTQDALKAQRNFLRQVIDLDPSFIFAKDEQGRFVLVNKALADTYGTTPEEMVGKNDEDFNPKRAEAEHFHRDDLEVVRKRQPKFIPEERLSNAVSGETRWYQTIKVPLLAADGQTVQLLGVATDITERKNIQDSLKEQRNFLRQVIDLDPSFIFAKDEEGRFLLANKALADAYGTIPEQMVGKYDEDFNPNRTETEHFRWDDIQVVRTRQPKFIPEEPVSNAVTGETRWYQTTKVPLLAADGQTIQLLGIATDITERKRAQEQLQQLVIHEQKARREAETATRLKDLFLANMSHELRTPLNAIIGFLREMLYSQQLNDDNTHMAERCLANGQRLLMLINSVLDLSRLATGSLEIVPSSISLRDLASTIVEDFQIQAKEKGLVLRLELDPALPEAVIHDEERLIQITTNLLANAVKFTNKGTVKLELKQQDGRLIIRVSDTGIGIPSSMQQIIFQDFVQLDSSSKKRYGGAGLGLSIVSNLVDLMKGRVTVESEVGEFSVFTVDIPLQLTQTG
ncbi:MAG: PAS domain-containing protein [Chloroflexi bacterium]|nr:PAS domain-containing protein [Chloroflexota bacterium]